ncbi:hypothetical protein MCHI_000665 [Candidatus Magnetoovum chiemensis]|nr:hypothetical protein MCHI_000665 [Candidatus Magnetoovum chiemensis]
MRSSSHCNDLQTLQDRCKSRLDSPLKRPGTLQDHFPPQLKATVTDQSQQFHIKISILYTEFLTRFPGGKFRPGRCQAKYCTQNT